MMATRWPLTSIGIAAMLILGGCPSTLIEDPERQAAADASHCSGSEGVDDSSVAVLPVPIVAFFVPHVDVNEIKADDYVKRCGESSRLVNREVKVDRTACVPAGLTRLITLGIWQWCPAEVSWEADVKP